MFGEAFPHKENDVRKYVIQKYMEGKGGTRTEIGLESN